MSDEPLSFSDSCRLDEHGRCTRQGGGGGPYAGHGLFWVPANMTGRRPWGWRRGAIIRVRERLLTIRYAGGYPVDLWHHVPLRAVLPPGQPVRLHDEMGVLDTPIGWLSVSFRSPGLGAVPAPAGTDPQLRTPEIVVTDLARGVAYGGEASLGRFARGGEAP